MKESLFILMYISCTLAITSWSGVATDVVLNDALSSGWNLCWSDLYPDNGTLLTDIMNMCSGDYIMYGCKQVDSPTFHIAAYAPRADVFNFYGPGNSDYVTSNGALWYIDDDKSMGSFNCF